MFKVGDRVKCISSFEGKNDLIGKTGRVVGLMGDSVGVSFDGWTGGHSLDGRVSNNSGRWGSADALKLIGKKKPTKFILKYDLDSDPIEECSSLDEVKERIEELVKDKEKNRLKIDSIVVYEVSKVYPIKVETVVSIKGI